VNARADQEIEFREVKSDRPLLGAQPPQALLEDGHRADIQLAGEPQPHQAASLSSLMDLEVRLAHAIRFAGGPTGPGSAVVACPRAPLSREFMAGRETDVTIYKN
jgi:hypothetical protein